MKKYLSLLFVSILIIFPAKEALADPTGVPARRIIGTFNELSADTLASGDSVTAIKVNNRFDMLQNAIIGLPKPSLDTGAATKKYVDDNLGSSSFSDSVAILNSGSFVSKADTVDFDTNLSVSKVAQGKVIIDADTSSQDRYLPDDPATSDIDMNNRRISNVEEINMGNYDNVGGDVPLGLNIYNSDGTGISTINIDGTDETDSFDQTNTPNNALFLGFAGNKVAIGSKTINGVPHSILRMGTYGDPGIIDGVDTAPYDTAVANKRYVDKRVRKTQSLPLTEITDGDTASVLIRTTSSTTFDLKSLGIQTDTHATLAGLKAEVYDHTNDTMVYSTNNKRDSGDPLGSVTGAADLSFRVNNDHGDTVNASAFFEYVEK